jgi:hypothetical protein
MSAIPNKVILLEPGLAPVVIELLLNRGGRLIPLRSSSVRELSCDRSSGIRR